MNYTISHPQVKGKENIPASKLWESVKDDIEFDEHGYIIDYLLDMLHNAYFKKRIPFQTVLMDTWYVSMKVMKAIEALSKVYYAPLKRNRLVNDTDGVKPHQQVKTLS